MKWNEMKSHELRWAILLIWLHLTWINLTWLNLSWYDLTSSDLTWPDLNLTWLDCTIICFIRGDDDEEEEDETEDESNHKGKVMSLSTLVFSVSICIQCVYLSSVCLFVFSASVFSVSVCLYADTTLTHKLTLTYCLPHCPWQLLTSPPLQQVLPTYDEVTMRTQREKAMGMKSDRDRDRGRQ